MVIFTWAYTALAGLPASILTDKFQGVTIMAFVIMLLVAALTLKSNEVSKKEFDDATGWLIGEENRGLAHMFTFINTSRVGTALQGVAAAELALQNSLPYALERRSMRALEKLKRHDNASTYPGLIDWSHSFLITREQLAQPRKHHEIDLNRTTIRAPLNQGNPAVPGM